MKSSLHFIILIGDFSYYSPCGKRGRWEVKSSLHFIILIGDFSYCSPAEKGALGSGVVASLYYSNREFFLLLPCGKKGRWGVESLLHFIILMGSGVVASLYYSNREFFLLLPLREKGPLGSEIIALIVNFSYCSPTEKGALGSGVVASLGAEAYRLMTT